MKKTLVVVACLVLSLVCAHRSAYAQRFPPAPDARPDVPAARIIGITLSPISDYGVKITVDQDHWDSICPEGYVLRKQQFNDINQKEAFATLLAAAMGHKLVDIWFAPGSINGGGHSDWGSPVCIIRLFQVRY